MQALQLQKTKRFIRAPRAELSRVRELGMGLMMRAWAFSVNECACSYTDFENLLGISRPTVGKHVKRMTQNGLLTQTKRFHRAAEYTVEGIDEKAPFVQLEEYFFTQEFSFEYKREKDGKKVVVKTETRTLHLIEILILGIIATRGHERNNAGKPFIGSAKKFSDMLGITPKTARKALSSLIAAKLVYCFDDMTSSRYNKQYKFRTPSEVLRSMNHKPPKEKKRDEAKELREGADNRADRERFYTQRREAALRPVERLKERIEADYPEYAEICRTVRSYGKKIAEAELYRPNELPRVQAEEEAWKQRADDFLKGIHIPPSAFIPKFVCGKCQDTGFLPNGHACDCYQP